jgi:signal transduction histidine kinase
MGLRTMKYRARMIGADINFTRRDSGGTIVRCSLPHIQVAPTPES